MLKHEIAAISEKEKPHALLLSPIDYFTYTKPSKVTTLSLIHVAYWTSASPSTSD